MTTDTAIRHPADPALYTDAMRSVAAADAAITTAMREQARQRETLRQAERQLADIRTEIQLDVADEAASAGRGSRLGNSEGRDAEVKHRLYRHPRAQALMEAADVATVALAEAEVALDAAVRQRKGGLASLQYAAAFLNYIASGAKQ